MTWRPLPQLLPEGGHVVVCHPERVERRAADLVRTGQEFLEASWLVAADSTEGRAPIDLGASAYRDLDVRARRLACGGAPVVDALEPRDRPRHRGRLPHP